MKKFVATFNDGSYLNLSATRMEIKEDAFVVAWNGDDLIAVVEIAGTVAIYMSDRPNPQEKGA